jgi:hypothetical protein
LLELKNKSQVTAFVIIGILVIGVVIVLLTLKPFSQDLPSEKQAQFQAIDVYIKDCISSVFTDAVLISSQQAGYVEIPEYTSLVNPLNPFSNVLEVSSNLAIPYWYYQDANTVQHESIPSLESMEEQISKYTKENIGFCFDNFSLFPGYSVSGLDNIKIETEIESEKIFMEITGPIDVSYRSSQYSIKRYADVFEIPLGSLYDTAVKIMELESQEFFFEERAIDIMVVYPEVPLTGITLDCSPNPWVLEDVKRSFKDIINTNVEAVKLQSSDNYFNLGINSKDTTAFFSFDQSWPLEFEVEPQKDGLLYPESSLNQQFSTAVLASAACVNNYNFVYNLKYPVLVKLIKNDHLFQFAFQVILRNNEPRQTTRVVETLDTDPAYFLCDKLAHNQEIKIYESKDNSLIPLEGADVSYKCISQTCDIGSTDSSGTLTKQFPQCFNGLLIVEKEGYLQSSVTFSTNQQSSTSLFLEPLQEKSLEIQLIDRDSGITKKVSNQKISLTISDDYGYVTTIRYPEQKVIEIAKGNYHLSSQVLVEGEFEFEEQTITKCVKVPAPSVLGLFIKKEQCTDITIDPISLDNLIIGGNNFDFTLSNSDLAKNKLLIYLIIEDTPKDQEDLSKIVSNIPTNHISNKFRLPLTK